MKTKLNKVQRNNNNDGDTDFSGFSISRNGNSGIDYICQDCGRGYRVDGDTLTVPAHRIVKFNGTKMCRGSNKVI